MQIARKMQTIWDESYMTPSTIIDHPNIFRQMLISDSGHFLSTIELAYQKIPAEKDTQDWQKTIKHNTPCEKEDIIEWLLRNGYKHDKDHSKWSYYMQGDTLHIFLDAHEHIRISLFGNYIDEITVEKKGVIKPTEKVTLHKHFIRTM